MAVGVHLRALYSSKGDCKIECSHCEALAGGSSHDHMTLVITGYIPNALTMQLLAMYVNL